MIGCDSFKQAKWYTNKNRSSVSLWVIHDEEYPERPDSAEAVQSYFAQGSRKASAHACVDNNSIAGCVDWADVAYHAGHGATNNRSIGIEHSGYAHQTRAEWLDPYGVAMLDRSARLFAQVGYGIYKIPPVKLSPADLKAGKSGILGHWDVSLAYVPGGHYDPGPNFPWDYFIDLCKKYCFGDTVTPKPPEEDDMYKNWDEESKKKFWDDFKLFAAPVITGSAVSKPSDKQTNLGDVVNTINAK